jgi:hypothetical protein
MNPFTWFFAPWIVIGSCIGLATFAVMEASRGGAR